MLIKSAAAVAQWLSRATEPKNVPLAKWAVIVRLAQLYYVKQSSKHCGYDNTKAKL